MNIILIGYRGSGKTSIGKKLAGELWKDFADVDQAARARFDNAAIADIWRTHGEPAWRSAEVEVTRQLCGRENLVIALGGGTLMQAGGRDAVEHAADAVRIYLYCEPVVLHQRIAGDAATAGSRPALTDQGGGIAEIEHVLAQRDPVYRAVADKVLDVSHLSIADAVRWLIKRCL
jgi:shikimate kinase